MSSSVCHVPQRENLSGCPHPRVADLLREPCARGELADVTGRLDGEKVDIDFPGRRLGGSGPAGSNVCCAEDRTPAIPTGGAPSGVPAGDSKLRLLKISSLPGLFKPLPAPSAVSTPASVCASNPATAGIVPPSGPFPARQTSSPGVSNVPNSGTLGSKTPLFVPDVPHFGTLGTPAQTGQSSSILPGDVILIVGQAGELLHAGTVTSDGRLAHIPLRAFCENSGGSAISQSVSARSVAAYCSRWRSAAGVKVLRKPWLPYHYTKRECYVRMRDGVRLYTAIYEPGEHAHEGTTVSSQTGKPAGNTHVVSPKPIILLRSPYPVGTYGYGGPGDLSDRIRCFTERGYIIAEQNVRGTFMSEGVFEDCRPLTSASHAPSPAASDPASADTPTITDEATDAYDTIDWLLANTRNNGSVGIYGVSYPGFYATCAAVCGHPALKLVSPQAPVTDWWMGDDAHHNGALMLCDMYGFGASFFRPKENPTPDTAESLSEIPEDADLYSWFRGKPVAGLLNLGEHLQKGPENVLGGFADIMNHPDYDEFWQNRNPLRHLKNVKPAVMVVGGWYDAEDAWGAEHTLKAIRAQSPETESYAVFGPWTHGGWRRDPYFLESIELPVFEYYLEGKGSKPAWRDLLIPTGIPVDAASSAAAGSRPPAELRSLRSLRPLPQSSSSCFAELVSCGPLPLPLSGGGQARRQSLPAAASDRSRHFAIFPDRYVSNPANPVPYMDIQSPWRDKSYMWADQRFAAARKDVLTQTLKGPLKEDFLATGSVRVKLVFSVKPAKRSRVKDSPDTLLDLDIVVKLIDVAPDGTMSLVRGDVCPARWRNSKIAPAPLTPGTPAELSFELAAICHLFAKGHSIALQVQSSWFPIVAMNPQTFLPNPYKAAAKDYRPVEVSILPGSGITI